MREKSDLDPKYVAWFAVGLAVALFVAGVVVWLALGAFSAREDRAQMAPALVQPQNTLPPEPRLQISPESDNRSYIEREKQQLGQYGWIDRDKGIVRIPIDRAMDLLIERGIR